jgi:hypothetical protein
METSGQPHILVPALEKGPWLPINRIQGGSKSQSDHVGEERETSCPSWDWILDCPTLNLVAVPVTLSWFCWSRHAWLKCDSTCFFTFFWFLWSVNKLFFCHGVQQVTCKSMRWLLKRQRYCNGCNQEMDISRFSAVMPVRIMIWLNVKLIRVTNKVVCSCNIVLWRTKPLCVIEWGDYLEVGCLM